MPARAVLLASHLARLLSHRARLGRVNRNAAALFVNARQSAAGRRVSVFARSLVQGALPQVDLGGARLVPPDSGAIRVAGREQRARPRALEIASLSIQRDGPRPILRHLAALRVFRAEMPAC